MATIGRFSSGGETFYGLLKGKDVYRIGNPFDECTPVGETHNLEDLRIEVPCEPSKIICVGLNYRDHALEMKAKLPCEPVIFLKPPSSLLRSGGNIEYPGISNRVDYEAELAIVIGRQCRNTPVHDSHKYILGYTCANDVTARDLQAKDGQWTRAKSFDSFLPLGPFIVSGINPDQLSIRLYLNGNLKQESNTSNFIFSTAEIVSFISSIMTLYPGDVILTGTPAGVGPMEKGDTVEVVIESVGTLVNTVK